MVVVVGDHATYHKKYDAPLESDIDALAGTVSGWVHRIDRTADVANDAAQAVAVSRAGAQISTLILPADVSWSDGAQACGRVTGTARDRRPDAGARGRGGAALGRAHGDSGRRGRHRGGRAWLRRRGLPRPPVPDCCARHSRRAWSAARAFPPSTGSAYFGEAAAAQLDGAKHLVLAGAKSPVSFFAYPGMPSDLVPDSCEVHVLAEYSGAARRFDRSWPTSWHRVLTAPVAEASRPPLPSGALTVRVGGRRDRRADARARDRRRRIEHVRPAAAAATAGAPAHDWLTLTGGAIGYGIPTAVGAAVAAPDRPVLCLESDGSAMYTISGLWTQARENLNVTTVIYDNSAYDILRIELQRVGAGSAPGPKALDLLDLSRPTMDFVKISEGMGVPARRVTTSRSSPTRCGRPSPSPGRT